MRRYALLIACLLGGGAREALASPTQNRATVMGVPPFSQGLEVELGLGDSPFRLGGQFSYFWNGGPIAPWNPLDPVGGRQQGDAWIGYQRDLAPDAAMGVIVGMYHARDEGVSMPVSVIAQETGGMVGVVYERTWGSVHLRLRPTLLVIPRDWVYLPWYATLAKSAVLSGIPWVEVGYRITPGLELGLRASLTPLALAVSF